MSLWAALRRLLTDSRTRDLERQVDDFRARRQAERQLDELRRRMLQIEAQHVQGQQEHYERGHQ